MATEKRRIINENYGRAKKKQAEKSDGMKKSEKPEEHLHKARIRTSQEYR